MTTRPGYVWDATASEWVEIGQATVLAPVKYQATAPSSPATGDIWIESDVDVPSIDSAQFLRWRKTMTGGETSLSGNDDSSLPLQYTPGYEQLYINGVLQVRGQDYTATTGTTVTGLTALVVNDVVEIFSAVARTVGDVYTQTQSDARFVNRNVGGLNLVVPTSVTNGTVTANGQVTFTGANSVSLNGCFSSVYDNYLIRLNLTSVAASGYLYMRMRNTTDETTSNYYWSGIYNSSSSTTPVGEGGGPGNTWGLFYMSTTDSGLTSTISMHNPFQALTTNLTSSSVRHASTASINYQHTATKNDTTSYSGFTIYPASSTFTGTIRIYGYNNGA